MINSLAEVSHNNDVFMASIQKTYTTVEEVNEALSNYALKTDIPEAVDLSGYAKNEQITNEENYTRTDISYTGAFPSRFTFNNDITINTLLEKGFVFKAQAATGIAVIDYGGKFESFGSLNNNPNAYMWVFAKVDNNEHRILITFNTDKTTYNLKISTDDVFNANYHNIFNIN